MDQTFQHTKTLIENIFQFPIQLLNHEKEIQNFCDTNILLPIQKFFHPQTLPVFFKQLSPNTIYHIQDELCVHFFLCITPLGPLAAGPFCPRLFSKYDCIHLLKQLSLPSGRFQELLSYYSQFPVLSESFALRIITQFLSINDCISQNPLTETINSTPSVLSFEELPFQLNHSQQIQKHYLTEKAFMDAIEKGNTTQALQYLRQQQRSFQSLKALGTTLENERIASAIVRTMVRIAALQAGLPPFIIHQLSRENTIATQKAKTVDAIFLAKEKMITSFCHQIQTQKAGSYSPLVFNVIHYIKSQYSQNLTTAQLAREFHISPNHLTTIFHKQTGFTPLHYLNRIRTEQAAHLLTSTPLSIQAISTLVGIPDANYFTKVFKREYGITPSSYRKRFME